MPFTTRTKRVMIENLTPLLEKNLLYMTVSEWNTTTVHGTGVSIDYGDKCFYFYNKMMESWRKERRWKTAHEIYSLLQYHVKANDYAEDTLRAYELAWQVFFNLHVMEYEKEKQELNGDI